MIQRLTSWIKVSQRNNLLIMKKMKPEPGSGQQKEDSKADKSMTAECASKGVAICDCLEDCERPEFPLLPASRGFCITLEKRLDEFKTILDTFGVGDEAKSS